jgi:hypothetical protein
VTLTVLATFSWLATLWRTLIEIVLEEPGQLSEGMTEDGEAIPSPSAIDAPLPDWAAEAAQGTRALVPAEVSARAARVNITLDEALLGRIDAAASEAGFTRSGFPAQAAREKLAQRAAQACGNANGPGVSPGAATSSIQLVKRPFPIARRLPGMDHLPGRGFHDNGLIIDDAVAVGARCRCNHCRRQWVYRDGLG